MREIAIRNDFCQEAFASFGTVIDRPEEAGLRRFYSDCFGSERPECAPVIHTNRNRPAALPIVLGMMERHPHAAQAFIPLDVARYTVTVAPEAEDGEPDIERLQSFLVPGNLGVIYRRNVWHAPASVLDSEGSFLVIMWRGADGGDDVVTRIEPVRLVEAVSAEVERA